MKDKYNDPEVDRFAKYWKIMNELEANQQQADYENKKNGKVNTHGVCKGTRSDSNSDAPEGNRDGLSHD